jgi:adenylate kinase
VHLHEREGGAVPALNVVMLGPPGAGKGTQAERLAERRCLPRISTGDILREAVQAGSPLGSIAQKAMDAGRLVSDDVMIGIVRERLEREDARRGFILDGFPRTVGQAEALADMLRERGLELDAVIEFKVDENALVRRVEKRAQETIAAGGTPRKDDTPETLRTRIAAYRQQTEPLVEHFRRHGRLVTVDGMRSVEEVEGEIARALAEPAARLAEKVD